MMQEENKKIFAVVGMCGSGKTEVVNYLVEKFRWPKVYLPEALFDEIKKDGLEVNWENEKKYRIGLREKHGMEVFAKLSMHKIEKGLEESDAVVIESLYSWSEHKLIKKQFPNAYRAIAVHASPAVRFSRLKTREVRPMKTFKEFEDRDNNEIEGIEKGGPIAAADYMFINEGSLKELHEKIDDAMRNEDMLK